MSKVKTYDMHEMCITIFFLQVAFFKTISMKTRCVYYITETNFDLYFCTLCMVGMACWMYGASGMYDTLSIWFLHLYISNVWYLIWSKNRERAKCTCSLFGVIVHVLAVILKKTIPINFGWWEWTDLGSKLGSLRASINCARAIPSWFGAISCLQVGPWMMEPVTARLSATRWKNRVPMVCGKRKNFIMYKVGPLPVINYKWSYDP